MVSNTGESRTELESVLKDQVSRIDQQLSRLTKEVDLISDLLSELRSTARYRPKTGGRRTRDEGKRAKQDVLGKLPLMLMNKAFFPTNDSLKQFASSLGMKTLFSPLGRESRAEIIGMIVVNVALLTDDQVIRMKNAIDGILQKETKPTSNFISEWEDVIKSFRFDR